MQHVLSKTRLSCKIHMLKNRHVFTIVESSRCLFGKIVYIRNKQIINQIKLHCSYGYEQVTIVDWKIRLTDG